MKLNLGCGTDYRDGWVNADFNRGVKPDVCADISGTLPFRDDVFEEVLLDNVIEHVPRGHYFGFLEELCRICRPGARICIYAPHFTSIYALKHPAHDVFFGTGSFALFEPEAPFNQERYGKALFRVRRERLMFFHHRLVHFRFLRRLPIDGLFNFGPLWRQFMERVQFLGFDEVYFELEVVKGRQRQI